MHPDQIGPWVPAAQRPLLSMWAKSWPWVLAGLVVLVYVLIVGLGATWTVLVYLGPCLVIAIWWREGGRGDHSKQKGPTDGTD